MTEYIGKGVYGAVAIGKVSIFKRQEVNVQRTNIQDVQNEKIRVKKAIDLSIKQLQEIYDKALKEVGETNAQIFQIHMLMLEDEDYNQSIEDIIETQMVNSEYAVSVTAENFSAMFSSMNDAYMQARAVDVKDISNRIIKNLTNTMNNNDIQDEKMVICADDLAPSETVLLDKDKILAFVTAYGSSNSHTSILARSMNIPAVIGLGEKFLETIKDGDNVIVNGFTGQVYINPNEETISKMEAKRLEDENNKKLLQKLKGKENITLDGTKKWTIAYLKEIH